MKKILALMLTAVWIVSLLPAIPMTAAADTNVPISASPYYSTDPGAPGQPSWQKAVLEPAGGAGVYTLINKDFDQTPGLTDSSAWYSITLTAIGNNTAWRVSSTAADKKTFKESMVIPGTVDGKPVTEIANDAFRHKSFRYMVLSENIETIGTNSFRETNLTGIRLPKSLTALGMMAFYHSMSLTEINLEDTALTSTGKGAFRDCPLTEVTLPATLKTLESAAFSNCKQLRKVTFLGSVEKCMRSGSGDNDTYAFNNTIGLTAIVFGGYTAPGYNPAGGSTTAANLTGFNTAGIDYQVTVCYPRGGQGYDTPAFIGTFRKGTAFAEVPRAEASLTGKPNIGAELAGTFSYLDGTESAEAGTGYWERCDTPYFEAGDTIERVSAETALQRGETASYTIRPEDSGKHLRFCVKIPRLDAGMPEEARLYASSATQKIDALEITLSANGSVAGNAFYIDKDEGLQSYGGAAHVVNSANHDQTFYLVTAWYDKEQGTLLEHHTDRITAPAGSRQETGVSDQVWTGTATLPENPEVLENRIMKVFAFRDPASPKPLARAEAYTGLYDEMAEVLGSNPGGLFNKAQIDFVREKVTAGEEPWLSAYHKMLSDADAWLDEEPSPPGNWFVPGFYSDAAGHQAARKVMLDDVTSAYACGLAYQFTGKTKYADQTVRILNAWAQTTRTIGTQDSALVGAYAGNAFPQAAELVKDYKGWRPEDKGRFDSWLNNVFRNFFNGTPGNNAGDWAILARVAINAYLGETGRVQTDADLLKSRIASKISENGELPEENARGGAGIWYTYFALAPMTAASRIIYNTLGEDLFNYRAENGRNLKMALDKHLEYCKDKSKWPYGGGYIGGNSATSWNFMLYEAMAGVYNDQNYADYVKGQRPINGPLVDNNDYHHMAWFYPTLLYGTLQLGGGLPA